MSPVNQSIAEKGTKCNAAGKEARQAVYRYTGIALPGVRRGAIRRGNTGGHCLHALVYWAGVQPAFSLVFRSPGHSSFASLRVGKCMRASSVTIGILSRRSASFSACVLLSRAFASALLRSHRARRFAHLAKYNVARWPFTARVRKTLFDSKTKQAPQMWGLFRFGIRQCPTLPGRHQPSTIGAERLNFCVRYGNRWIPFAITTGMP